MPKPKEETRQCAYCGVEFTPKRWNSGEIFCGNRCRRRDQNEYPR
jgi:endogenous inhibitor of DNA gyrase (YacG/DUF329 family)